MAYLCGVLNSELVDLWYGLRGRVPRDIWRDYEPKPLKAVPYRRPEGDRRADEIAELVREIAANRRSLLPHRAVIRELGRIIKDPWRAGSVEIDRPALIDEVPKQQKVSVRLDPRLNVQGTPSGRVGRVSLEALVFRRGRDETGRIVGDPARLDLLAAILGQGSLDAAAILLPKDTDAFAAASERRLSEVQTLLDEGRTKVERVERLVCGLYGVPGDLIEEIVEHAVARAAR